MVIRRRLNITGPAAVFVTTTVVDWIPLLADKTIGEIILRELIKTVKQYRVSLMGYVIMPSHIHALLGFRGIERLSDFMKCFKSVTSRQIGRLHLTKIPHGKHQLWKPRFDDVIIYSEEQFRIKLQYIHNNPVRAGLVAEPQLWRLSSAAAWLKDEPGVAPIDKKWNWLK